MKEKKKKESALKKGIKELKKTSRGKAILRLIKWFIFFIVLFIFIAISSTLTPKKNDLKPKEDLPLKEEEQNNKLDFNFKSSYSYKYEVNVKGEKYLFTGFKEGVTDEGYKESKEGILKYLIDDTGIYNVNGEEKSLIDNLYEGIDFNYLDPVYILTIIRNLEFITEDNMYKASDKKNDYVITVNNKEITNISVKALDFSYVYNLSFNY